MEAAEKKDEEAINKLKESVDKNLTLARQYLQKSIELKADFQPALDLLKQLTAD